MSLFDRHRIISINLAGLLAVSRSSPVSRSPAFLTLSLFAPRQFLKGATWQLSFHFTSQHAHMRTMRTSSTSSETRRSKNQGQTRHD